MPTFGLTTFLSTLTEAEAKRWDELLISGLQGTQARDAFRPEFCAQRLSAPLLKSLVRLAAEQGEVAIRAAMISDAFEYHRNGSDIETLLQHYWDDGPYDSEIVDRLEDTANEVWRDACTRSEILTYLFQEGFLPAAMTDAPVIDLGVHGEGLDESTYRVILTSYGGNKLQVLKELRTFTAFDLQKAKSLVENLPQELSCALLKIDADDLAGRFRQAGASVEIHSY